LHHEPRCENPETAATFSNVDERLDALAAMILERANRSGAVVHGKQL